MSTTPQTRRFLAAARAAAEGSDRYQDLLLHLRSVRADFAAPVGVDHEFTAGGIEFVTVGEGKTAVPVRSMSLGESAKVPDGACIEGDVAGVLRCEVLLSAGGVWDRHKRRWAERPASAPHVLDLVESQHEIVRAFGAWLQRYKARRARPPAGEVLDILTMLAYGDRGSGKTFICMALVAAALLEIPDSVGWFVVENRPASQEDVHESFARMLPEAWKHWQGQPVYCWRMVNGSRLYEKSADEPSTLKQGRVDVLLLNEAAKLPETVFGYASQRTKDRGGGMTLGATNPPTLDKPRGMWVYRLHEYEREAAAKGEWCEVKSFHLDSADNATIDRGANKGLKRLLRVVSPKLASADAEGLMVLPGERIIKTFDAVKHGLQEAPSLGDITEVFCRRHPRIGRPFRYLAGLDFQGTGPGIVCTFFKVYGTVERPILWAVSERAARVDEETFLDDLLDEGIRVGENEYDDIEPTTVCWIGDSSAQWQSSTHDDKIPPSFIPWLNRGLYIISPTLPVTANAKYGKNPPVGRSLGQVNRMFADGRCFVSPLAQMLLTACREGRAEDTPKGIRPDKASSHPLDTLRYAWWLIEPPTRRKPANGFKMASAVSLPRR